MKIRRKTGFIFMSLFIAFFLAACGGGGDSGSTTPAPVLTPVVTTVGASSISVDNALLNGTVNPNGLATTAWFEWGTSPTLATWDNTSPSISVGAGSAASVVSKAITGLTSGTTYYFRVAASNSEGTTKGLIVSLATASPLDPPIVQTFAADNISVSGATLHANVIPNGLATNAFFQWGTDNTFAVPSVTSTQAIGSDNTSHAIAANLTGLTTGTKYYYRVVATNSRGTSNGATANFTTNALAPTVTTDPATSITTSAATLNGTVNPNGLLTTAHFEYGTVNNPATFSSTSNQSAGSGLTGNPLTASLPVTAATTYYFRVVASNSAGDSAGTVRSFTTPANPPPVAVAHYSETVYTNGPGTDNTTFGTTVVSLLGSDSFDLYGTITSFLWEKIAGTNNPTLANPSDNNTTFTVPSLAYGETDNLVYRLTVTDNRALTGTDNIYKFVKWGYFDDFSTDSTGAYEVFGQETGGTFEYDASGHRAKVVNPTGSALINIVKRLPEIISGSPGVFSMDFHPTSAAGTENISIRLTDTADTHYELSLSTRSDSIVKKVWHGVEESAPFPFSYSQDGSYSIKITFSPSQATFTVAGVTVDLNPTNTNNITPSYLEVTTTAQTVYYDNIKLEAP